MVPTEPITLKLMHGEEITFTVEEMNHPLFKMGWELAERGRGSLGGKYLMKIGNSAFDAHLYRVPLQTTRKSEGIRALFSKQEEALAEYPREFKDAVGNSFPHDANLHRYLESGAPYVGKILSVIRLERALTSQLVRTLLYENNIEKLKEKAEKAYEIEKLYDWWCRIYYHQK